MSSKSKKSSSKKIDRPFADELWQRAAAVAEGYQVILSCDAGEWHGRGLELPHVFGEGKTASEAAANTIEGMSAAVAYLLETGQQPPAAGSESSRTEEIKVRMTLEERLLLESSAKAQGFRGLPDFLRSTALAATRA